MASRNRICITFDSTGKIFTTNAAADRWFLSMRIPRTHVLGQDCFSVFRGHDAELPRGVAICLDVGKVVTVNQSGLSFKLYPSNPQGDGPWGVAAVSNGEGVFAPKFSSALPDSSDGLGAGPAPSSCPACCNIYVDDSNFCHRCGEPRSGNSIGSNHVPKIRRPVRNTSIPPPMVPPAASLQVPERVRLPVLSDVCVVADSNAMISAAAGQLSTESLAQPRRQRRHLCGSPSDGP